MNGHVGLLHPLSATHIRQRLRNAGENGADRLDVAATHWDRVDQLQRQHLLGNSALRVDEGRLSRDSHGLLETADVELNVEGCREVCRQLDGITLECIESRQCKRHGIGTRAQIKYLVLPPFIGDGGTAAFNQRRTRSFHCHSW